MNRLVIIELINDWGRGPNPYWIELTRLGVFPTQQTESKRSFERVPIQLHSRGTLLVTRLTFTTSFAMNQTTLVPLLLILFVGITIWRTIGLIPLVFAVLGFGTWLVVKYNESQALAQQVRENHSNIMVSMKKRVDLANKLVDIARNYGDHEKLTHITVAQSESMGSAIATSNQQISNVLSGVMAMSRDYPELRASEAYQLLMQQLEQLEADLQQKREFYNSTVRTYNTGLTQIPFVFVSSQLGFKAASYFNVENSDTLENLKDFQTDDGATLKAILSGAGNQVIATSRVVGAELSAAGKQLIDKKQELTVGQQNRENGRKGEGDKE